jgi:TPP-dependent pyruvate/acetoin dehydrogenase alpha subunit
MTKSKTELAPADEGFSLISNRKLLTLYGAMVECRRIAERPGKLNRMGNISLLGHEAAAVGAAIDLLPQDTLSADAWPEAAIKAINPSVVIAAKVAAATGSAIAGKDAGKITVLFSTSKRALRPSWARSLRLAAEHNLSILFVSITPETAASNPLPTKTIPTMRRGYAFPHISVDSHDVVAVFRVASEAITHARKGHGPTLIDCKASASGDSLENMRKYLSGKGLFPF